MPTDEQPRTYFYGYYISFDVTGVEPVDHVLKAVADAGRGSHHTEDWKELGLEEEIQRAAHEAAAVFQARDAEVQALREALTEVTEDLASEILAKHGPIRAHPDTVRSFDREMEPVRRARKLLAGGETGEAERPDRLRDAVQEFVDKNFHPGSKAGHPDYIVTVPSTDIFSLVRALRAEGGGQ